MTSVEIFRGAFRNTVMALVLTGTVVASASATDSSWTTIDEVRGTPAGALVIKVPSGKNGCGGTMIMISDTARADDLRPIAVAAFLAGRQILLKDGTCSNSPWTNTLTTTDLSMK